jgi:signal transduction histidine kinase/CheY-like chemotaxis protein
LNPERLTPALADRVEYRVLLVPPTARDARAIESVLADAGIECVTCDSMATLCGCVDHGAGAVVVSEQALAEQPEGLIKCLAAQPVWGDLPVVVLSRTGAENPTLSRMLEQMGSVSVVERPVRISTFLSIVHAALRSRLRQYQVRDHLKQLSASEAERSAALEAERHARAEAERAGRMKDEFLATLSHEIRTPLNAILGWTHLLGTQSRDDEELRQGLAVIERNAKAQSQIVADLLDMNRIINGKVRLDTRPLALADAVRAAVDTVVPAAGAKGIRLDVDLDPAAEPISGDPDRLQQVFWNLLSNAVKFTRKGEHVRVVLRHAHTHQEVSVIDTGEGIDPEFLPYVFDRFRQADGSTTRRHGGLGLGLAIVKQLVELHGGSVRATSEGRGKGSTFLVSLPLATSRPEPSTADRGPRTEGASTPQGAPAEELRHIRALVVDDEPDSRNVVVRLLHAAGATVFEAASAQEALALAGKERPHVIISDIGMPGEDGYSLMRRLHSAGLSDRESSVAVALTAYARTEDRVAAMRAGFQYHLAKPVDPAELIAVLATAVRQASSGHDVQTPRN